MDPLFTLGMLVLPVKVLRLWINSMPGPLTETQSSYCDFSVTSSELSFSVVVICRGKLSIDWYTNIESSYEGTSAGGGKLMSVPLSIAS